MDNQKNIIQFITLLIIVMNVLHLINGFEYDSASSCDPKMRSRKARARIISSIPCDLSQQGYCNLPGSLYPWHAVRRFVTENQGLMKRMYGDMRHISVLKNEIDNNGIDIHDIELAANRYSKKGQKKSKFLRNDFPLNRNNEVISEPHFRPTTSSTSSTTTKPPTNPTKEKLSSTIFLASTKDYETTFSTVSATISLPTTKSNPFIPTDNKISTHEIKVDSIPIDDLINARIEINLTHKLDNGNIQIIQPPNLSLSPNKSIEDNKQTETISSTLKKVTTTVQIPFRLDKEQFTTVQMDELLTSLTTDHDYDLDATISTTPFSESDDITIEDEIVAEESQKYEKFIQKEDYLGEKFKDEFYPEEELKSNFQKTETTYSGNGMEGQLFQDVVQKDAVPVMIKGKGINACPVKEEVVAPFWANNTRGEVLALLNLYPFEQYVHWEKCTHEDKQMYCRDGCRCEQQYSLHRLLAYDPNNDCRGIFSDWFRFPSCCVCKCYNIPGLEFRGTSRSPRSIEIPSRHPADLAQEELRNAIYSHATEDWYRRRDSEYAYVNKEKEFDG